MRKLFPLLAFLFAVFSASAQPYSVNGVLPTYAIIPPGAVYTNFGGPFYQLNLVPGQTYLAVVTNAGASVQDNNFDVNQGGVFTFVAPAGSQLGGNDPTYVGGSGTETVGGAVQEQVYATAPASTANIATSNLVVSGSFTPWGAVTWSMIFDPFSISNQVAIGSSPTNGIDFQNGKGINFDINGSPWLRMTNPPSSGPIILIDNSVGLGWGVNSANIGPEIFYSPTHGGDPEWIFSTGSSVGFGIGIGLQGKSVCQLGSAGSAHEIFYLTCDGQPGQSDSTGEGWSANLNPSKSLYYQYGWFTNSTLFMSGFTTRAEPLDIAGNAAWIVWDSTQTLRATNSSVPGNKIFSAGKQSGAYYANVNGSFIAGTTNIAYTTLESAGTFGLRNWTTNNSFTITTNLAIGTLFLNKTNLTITLPDCTQCSNRIYTVKNLANSPAALATTSTQHIDGTSTAPEYTIPAQYGAVTVQSDGVQWWILSKF